MTDLPTVFPLLLFGCDLAQTLSSGWRRPWWPYGDICSRALLVQRGQDLGWFLIIRRWPMWLLPALMGDLCDILVPAWPWGGAAELSGPWVCSELAPIGWHCFPFITPGDGRPCRLRPTQSFLPSCLSSHQLLPVAAAPSNTSRLPARPRPQVLPTFFLFHPHNP